jgi:hypothetical protein
MPRLSWAGLLGRTFVLDVLACAGFGGRRRVFPQTGAEPGQEEESPAFGTTVEAPRKERTPRLDSRRDAEKDVRPGAGGGCWRAVKGAGGVRAMVEHLGLPTAIEHLAPERGPPQSAWCGSTSRPSQPREPGPYRECACTWRPGAGGDTGPSFWHDGGCGFSDCGSVAAAPPPPTPAVFRMTSPTSSYRSRLPVGRPLACLALAVLSLTGRPSHAASSTLLQDLRPGHDASPGVSGPSPPWAMRCTSPARAPRRAWSCGSRTAARQAPSS